MLRTLIVEDNVTFRQSFRDMLHQEFPSMEILETSNGEEALRQAELFILSSFSWTSNCRAKMASV